MGKNDSELITSELARKGTSGADLSDMGDTAAAEMITEHLAWCSFKGADLVSWTTSLLFALQLAIYRKAKDHYNPTAASIWICVVDTSMFDSGLFHSAADLMRRYGIQKVGIYKYGPEDLAHEYLMQGTIHIIGNSATTSLESLIGAGLYKHFSDLRRPEKAPFLHTRVLELRVAFLGRFTSTSTKSFASIKSLASKGFGDTWVLPMTIAFLTLRRRYDREIFPLLEIPLSFCDSEPLPANVSSLFGTKTSKPLEVQQFVRIWKIREDHLKTGVADELEEPENSNNQDPSGLEALVESLSLNSN